MWLRDFLSKDLPRCRTMTYGYNSKLSSHGIGTILDYGREFLEEIKKIRTTTEVNHNFQRFSHGDTYKFPSSQEEGRCFSSLIVSVASF
jgi:hypothetical protein